MSNPISRVLACYLQDPETPDSVVCSDVIESSGTQPLYDWNEINLGNAGGNHQALIPDGQLCSAGREKYAAFDEARTDWDRTIMPDSGAYTFLYDAYVPHNNGYFELWVTKDGYDPTVPLKWSDIEQFAVIDRPPVVGDNYEMTVDLPEGKSGHHVIYSIWQRNDSPEAFYACSDVWFGDSPTPAPTAAPACSEPAWNSATTYYEGDLVSHNGAVWRANWGSAGTEPSDTAAPWRIRAYCSSDGSVTPIPPTDVPPTATDTPGEEPTNTPVPPTATTPPTSGSCSVDYVIANQWGSGFQADVTITNNKTTAVSGWTLDWTHASTQMVTSGWNAGISQTGNSVHAQNVASHWNGTIAAGSSVSFGFQANHTGSVVIPVDFALNAIPCNGVTVTPPPSPTPTDIPVTAPATVPPPTDEPTIVPPTATSVPPTPTVEPEITPTATSEPAGVCLVDYTVNDWGSGFTAELTITNNDSSSVDGWILDWAYDGNQTVTNYWNSTVTQTGTAVSAANAPHNSSLSANGGTASFGFNASYSGTNNVPTSFTLNGTPCN